MRLDGRVAVITGGASGIGLGLGEAFAAEGARIVLCDLDPDAAVEAAAMLTERGSDAVGLQLDVGDADAVEAVAEVIADRYGALHVAVNSAGIVNRGLSWELGREEWERVIDVNLWGVIHGVRAFVPRILDTGEEGYVVNIGSMASVLPHERLGPYTVAKHGVLGLSDVLRADLAAVEAPVGVSVVLPGRVRTGMNPIGTVEPAVVADNVLAAMAEQRPYVFTDDHSAEAVRARLESIIAARDDVMPTDDELG